VLSQNNHDYDDDDLNQKVIENAGISSCSILYLNLGLSVMMVIITQGFYGAWKSCGIQNSYFQDLEGHRVRLRLWKVLAGFLPVLESPHFSDILGPGKSLKKESIPKSL